MGVVSDGSYEIEEGLVCGTPCECSGGDWKRVEDLEITDFSRERINGSVAELKEERDAVKGLGLI
jgi:malate dehydrogenase